MVAAVLISEDDENSDADLDLGELENELRAALSATSHVAGSARRSAGGATAETATAADSKGVSELDDYEQLMKEAKKLQREQSEVTAVAKTYR